MKTLIQVLVTLIASSVFVGCDKGDDPNSGPVLTVTSLAGSTNIGSANGQGAAASFYYPCGLGVSKDGKIYIADHRNNNIRVMEPNGTVTTLAGTTKGYENGPVASAKFDTPVDVAVDNAGNVYVADLANDAIRKITPAGVVSTLASIETPRYLVVDANGSLYVNAGSFYGVLQVTPDGTVSGYAGGPLSFGFQDGAAGNAKFEILRGIAIDGVGNIYVADGKNSRIRKITTSGEVLTIAGKEDGYVDDKAALARFRDVVGIAIDSKGNIFISEKNGTEFSASYHWVIRMISVDGTVRTLAGGEGDAQAGAGLDAKFSDANDLAVDANGVVYIADQFAHRIWAGTLTN